MSTTRKHFFIILLFIVIIAVCATGFTLHHFAEEGQNDYISAKTIFTDKLQDNSTELNFWLGDRCYTSTDKEIIHSVFTLLQSLNVRKSSEEPPEEGYLLELTTKNRMISFSVSSHQLSICNKRYETDEDISRQIYEVFFGEEPAF